ncbi:nickel pincer cofactor biosynthesis protein LarC [Tautonia rosea]|uniref:nickel pincer cofactor biosynthesis protein LarC n=1 Tax=Tautonia rosea TaxID=2728037 RepID=UPI0014739CEC|nr:nickel pincer cofactor biosynthesis protein LarC [Tautonia rosea]
MRIAYFDCFSGISGDMTLGALVDSGVDPQAIVGAVRKLGLEFDLSFETVRRCGFRATYARVVAPEEHAHRHLPEIEAMIDRAELPHRQSDLAKRIFHRLGEAEANSHGIPIEQVHFHEVGAVDSIVDIVGAAVGLDLLGVERFQASAIPPGRGSVVAAHGRMPLPAPATAELLRGVPLADSPVEMELTTPTGAAIVSTICERFGPLPSMTVETIGLGAGTKDLPGQANMVRLFVGTVADSPDADRIWVLETNLDDLPGELVGYTTGKLMEAGALDAFVTPIYMKKNRPGVMLSVLGTEASLTSLEAIIFRETTTLGIRRYPVSRHKLRRKAAVVETPLGPVRGKLGWLGDRPPTFSPEYDDCARLAAEQHIPLKDVYQMAHEAHASSGAAPLEPPVTDDEPKPHQSHGHSHDHGHGHAHHHGDDHHHGHDHHHDH